MTNKILILFVIVAVIAISCSIKAQSKTEKGYSDLDTEELISFVDKNKAQLLDVRTKEEFEEGHIKNAILIDVNSDDFVTLAKNKLDKSKPVAVYCRSGRRSAHAAELLVAEGFKVANLSGGILKWISDGKETVK